MNDVFIISSASKTVPLFQPDQTQMPFGCADGHRPSPCSRIERSAIRGQLGLGTVAGDLTMCVCGCPRITLRSIRVTSPKAGRRFRRKSAFRHQPRRARSSGCNDSPSRPPRLTPSGGGPEVMVVIESHRIEERRHSLAGAPFKPDTGNRRGPPCSAPHSFLPLSSALLLALRGRSRIRSSSHLRASARARCISLTPVRRRMSAFS